MMSNKLVITEEMKEFFLADAKKRFLEYVKIDTTSDPKTNRFPSNPMEIEFGKKMVSELEKIGMENIEQDKKGYVYAILPASKGYEHLDKLHFIAHMDTSFDACGKNIEPIIHENYDGSNIVFPKDSNLILNPEVSPYLGKCIGMDIITSSGDTLLGTDDKAGISEIITAVASLKKYQQLKHGEVIVCFTPDEEVGKGVDHINMNRLAKFGYTVDGGEMGDFSNRCFDAYRTKIKFFGISNHPGSAKNRMVNAIKIAGRFISALPEAESPEHTEKFEGFYHLLELKGNVEEAFAEFIIRDFSNKRNIERIKYLEKLKELFEMRYPVLTINIESKHSYENMENYLTKHPELIERAKNAILDSGIELIERPVRGGTDGGVLSSKGHPTPNIFTGGALHHSRREFIPVQAFPKAAEVIIRIICAEASK